MSRIKKPPGGLNKGVHAALSSGSFQTPMSARRLTKFGGMDVFTSQRVIEPVNVGTPDARFGTYLLEQFGGATGAATASPSNAEPR